MRMYNLQGYTLPLSPTGQSALVQAPPWYFGADVLEVSYKADLNLFRQFLPHPFEFSNQPGLVNITISDMTTVCTEDDAFNNPERTIYQECLVRLHCSLNGKTGWYVPNAFVNNDFTLIRGFIQGFGKKLAKIYLGKFDDFNPKIGGKRVGAKRKGICEVFNSANFELSIELEEQTQTDCYAGNTMFVMRHFPDIENPGRNVVHEISELVVKDFKREEIWHGRGAIFIRESKFEEITQLQPIDVVSARVFREGYKLIGGRIVHRYNHSD